MLLMPSRIFNPQTVEVVPSHIPVYRSDSVLVFQVFANA